VVKFVLKLVDTNIIIQASAEKVWKIITDTDTWPIWGPSVRKVRCRDRYIQASSTGYIQTFFGVWLPFEITKFVESIEWQWRVAHINATGHRVIDLSQNLSRLTFEVSLIGAPYLVVCAIAARRIKNLAEK
jgi:hypothetical protein